MRVIWWAMLVLMAGAIARGGEPTVMGYDPLRQLVLDSRVRQSWENARLVLGRVEKESRGALFAADRPWENALNNLYPNVWYDVRERSFKLWYKCVLHDADVIARMDRPTTIHDQGWYLLYATSRDGLSWTKPELGQHRFGGSAATNAVTRDTPNAGVMFDPHDANPARRFKMIYDVGPGKLRTRFSSDGVQWSEPSEPTGFSPYHGDTHNNAFWDERLQKYVLFSRAYYGERLVARFESDDFQTWQPTGIVLRSSIAEGRVTQTYCLPAFPYGNVYLGYAMMYHPGRDRSVDCELAWSPDSITWQRVAPGQSLIPRGSAGSGDSACIYGPAGPAIAQDDRLLIFYGGSDTPHRDWKRHCLPMLARLPVDGFMGCEPIEPARVATFTTQPLLVASDALTLSTESSRGAIRVRVLDAAGFSSDSSEPIRRDGSAQRVTWPGHDWATLRGQIVRLQFELDRAALFGFHGLRQLAAPTIDTGVRRFDESLTIRITRPTDAETVRYTLDGREPTRESNAVDQQTPITLNRSTRVRSRAFWPNVVNGGPELDMQFTRREPPQPPSRIVSEGFSFDASTEGWQGIDELKHITQGGLQNSGFIRLTRPNNLHPFAQRKLIADKDSFAGDWPKHFGGDGAMLSFALRSETSGGRARLEIFAGDLASWHRELTPGLTSDWQTWTTTVRWDWNDAEAEAAGWHRTAQGFPWSDTIRHVGQLVIMPAASTASSFDLDDVKITTWPETMPR